MRKLGKQSSAAVLAIGLATTGALVAPAMGSGGGHKSPVHVITDGLDGPFGLARLGHGFVVAENVSGEVTWVGPKGGQKVLVRNAPGVSGVATGKGYVYSALGGPNEEGAPPTGDYKPTSVLRTKLSSHKTVPIANLLRYELKHNPDGQKQFVNGESVDTLSNPFAMTRSGHSLLVADGGANAVLRVNTKTGKVSTFFVPRTVKDVKACLSPEAQANPGTVGCDPVPTGVAVANGSVYVSTLGAEVPGAGRVYKLHKHTGKVQRVWKGLTAPTGVAVGRHGSVYVSEVLFGAPEGEEPPPGFDPADVGRITKIGRYGKVTHAQVTMPTGLLFSHGNLYSTAWSVAFFLGIEGAGQIVKVKPGAFH
jgi:hypothetical protein